jgi:hypothetical protein
MSISIPCSLCKKVSTDEFLCSYASYGCGSCIIENVQSESETIYYLSCGYGSCNDGFDGKGVPGLILSALVTMEEKKRLASEKNPFCDQCVDQLIERGQLVSSYHESMCLACNCVPKKMRDHKYAYSISKSGKRIIGSAFHKDENQTRDLTDKELKLLSLKTLETKEARHSYICLGCAEKFPLEPIPFLPPPTLLLKSAVTPDMEAKMDPKSLAHPESRWTIETGQMYLMNEEGFPELEFINDFDNFDWKALPEAGPCTAHEYEMKASYPALDYSDINVDALPAGKTLDSCFVDLSSGKVMIDPLPHIGRWSNCIAYPAYKTLI